MDLHEFNELSKRYRVDFDGKQSQNEESFEKGKSVSKILITPKHYQAIEVFYATVQIEKRYFVRMIDGLSFDELKSQLIDRKEFYAWTSKAQNAQQRKDEYNRNRDRLESILREKTELEEKIKNYEDYNRALHKLLL